VNTTVSRAHTSAAPARIRGLEPRDPRIPGSPPPDRAFTLLELLVVIAILGVLAALSAPTLRAFKPNVMAAATQQLLTDLGRARQLAIVNRTTVYMVFVPTNFYDPAGAYSRLPTTSAPGTTPERDKADKLLNKQLIGYNFVSLRGLGEQPGVLSPRYLSQWRTLPEGTFIALQKFAPPNYTFPPITNGVTQERFPLKPFPVTNNIPFPSEMVSLVPNAKPYVPLPYVAFNYLGQLVSRPNNESEIIPLARGSVSFGKDATKAPTKRAPTFVESPPGNSTNNLSFNLIYIDGLTGRAHVERVEVR
jgi:prepilin-type N-terminal cleavage/methylation domain-containing protein